MVCANTCPKPPVARTTALAIARPTPSRLPAPITCKVTPQTSPISFFSASKTSAFSTTSISGSFCTAASSARETSAPVASPPAWMIRLRKCPPSRVNAISPLASLSKIAPRSISLRTASGPSVTNTRTESTSQRPAPATKVSFSCASGESPSPSAAAIPPCAHLVEPSSTLAFVTSRTDKPNVRHCSAVVSPAIPEPTTMTSACAVQPGAGASNLMSVAPSAYCQSNGPHLSTRRRSHVRALCAGRLVRNFLHR